MYTHATQFPHLAGMPTAEIKHLLRQELASRPHLVLLMRLRNLVVLAVLFLVPQMQSSENLKDFGAMLAIAGVATTALLLVWNWVWLNTVVYPLTLQAIRSRGVALPRESVV